MSKTMEAVNMLSSLRQWLPRMSSRLPRLQYSVSTHTEPGSTHAPTYTHRARVDARADERVQIVVTHLTNLHRPSTMFTDRINFEEW